MAARYRETGKLLIQPEDDASISPMIVNADAFEGKRSCELLDIAN